MDLNEVPGGLSSRISGLLFALLRHLLALTELAAEETRILIRQSITAILLLASLVVTVVIAYLAILGCVIALLTAYLGWGWMAAFALVAFFHLLLAGALLIMLRTRTAPTPYEATSAELRRDLDQLGKYSKKSSSIFPK